ncbi:MAG: hypothetical protein OHK0040_04340 [bacterium]
MRFITFSLLLIAISSCSAATKIETSQAQVYSGIINKKVVWKGKVTVDKDLMIDEKGEVLIEAGTVVEFVKSDISRTEPIFLYPETELLVKGKLIIDGEKERPIIFKSAETQRGNKDWAGIVLQQGLLKGQNFVIRDAYNGIVALNGTLDIDNVDIDESYIGISVFNGAKGRTTQITVKRSQTGIVLDNSNVAFNNVTITKCSEGLLLRGASQSLYNFSIFGNRHGVVLNKNSLSFLVGDNKIYDNENNLFIFGATDSKLK